MSEEKAREFWIYNVMTTEYGKMPIAFSQHRDSEGEVHVIEYGAYDKLRIERDELKKELARISCGFCGELFERDWDELRGHILVCEKHPTAKLAKENAELRERLCDAKDKLESVKMYYNERDKSFRNMVNTFSGLSPDKKEKLIDLTRSLADLASTK